jgi:ribosomal protein L40E
VDRQRACSLHQTETESVLRDNLHTVCRNCEARNGTE